MENILSNLNLAINSANEQKAIECLKTIISKPGDFIIIEVGPFKKLLKIPNKSLQTVVAESIAELCTIAENRKVFTDEEVIRDLMHFIESGSDDLIFSTVRALGNICYDNEQGSELINKLGIDSILEVLRSDSKRDNDSLTTKVSGLLVNLLNTHDDLPKAALNGGILPIVKTLLIKYKHQIEKNRVVITYLLSILNLLTDYLDDKEYIFSEDLAKLVIDIFKETEIPDIGVLCLEIFHPLLERDDIKLVIAKEGVCELLCELIEKYRDKVNDDDGRSVLRMACDFIVLTSTEDACMNLLYNEGKGKTYQNMLTWLNSDDADLLSTGILAIGNFARNDFHCIQMVNDGIANNLIELLKKYNESTDINDVKVQHALLSTLKNLVIPKENKAKVLKEDIIEVMYPMLKQNRFMVVFKLLGTYRMVIDGQPEAAFNLLLRKDFIERLVYWCYNSDHLGVRGKVPQIFCSLVKNSHSSSPFSTFLSIPDSTKCIVEMISSNRGVMQNESFLALCILAVGLSNNEKHAGEEMERFYKTLCDSDIGKNLNFVMNKYGEKWDQHTMENCLTMLENLVKSSQIVVHLMENNISECLEKLKNNGNAKDILTRVDSIIQILTK
ncbi:rap1 GTPase-GDP dissociation stimulator 1 isoform X2 [Sitophilus oryzae]|uniref:Rap1 GTPase-GDP dissociation stimulator 1 isoform X2 n=1 Tax=Sitophilus oryzae TaxID=7048 RepID=A0A6J2XXF7_SITOR|nr:rap1 GTPase-GDP dissociation stimulator 1 isoform X2 [Sitophilus oryzae]